MFYIDIDMNNNFYLCEFYEGLFMYVKISQCFKQCSIYIFEMNIWTNEMNKFLFPMSVYDICFTCFRSMCNYGIIAQQLPLCCISKIPRLHACKPKYWYDELNSNQKSIILGLLDVILVFHLEKTIIKSLI